MNDEGHILLEARGLARRDGGLVRLHPTDLVLRKGEVTALLGVNGAGKSTLLALLAGALRPGAGRVRVLGHDLHRDRRRARRQVGYLPQRPPLYPDLTLDENLEFAARLRGLSPGEARPARERIKKRLELDGLGRRLAGRLSGGMARRAALAQALVHRPRVLLLDEPTAALDPPRAQALRDLLGELAEECAILFSTHLLADLRPPCRRVLVMRRGAVVDEHLLDGRPRARIRLLRPPPTAALAALPGVLEATPLGEGWFELQLEAEQPALAERLAGRGWELDRVLGGAAEPEWLVNELLEGTTEAA